MLIVPILVLTLLYVTMELVNHLEEKLVSVVPLIAVYVLFAVMEFVSQEKLVSIAKQIAGHALAAMEFVKSLQNHVQLV